jgi:hypothetical protein
VSGEREQRRREHGRQVTAGLSRRNASRSLWSAEAREAVGKYPPLGCVPTSQDVLTCARVLDALPSADRAAALDEFACQNQDVLAALAEKQTLPGRAERMKADPALARLVAVIESHSTPFDRETFAASHFRKRARP